MLAAVGLFTMVVFTPHRRCFDLNCSYQSQEAEYLPEETLADFAETLQQKAPR